MKENHEEILVTSGIVVGTILTGLKNSLSKYEAKTPEEITLNDLPTKTERYFI